ncbi:MAG: hypothetical protein ACOX7Q_08540 [Kiritimatiellia bacterium]|nr:hypothetical protein [Kiritimatiellia bacterium]HHU13865.1 hypothetical protein [Lentisphaerota bacterium]
MKRMMAVPFAAQLTPREFMVQTLHRLSPHKSPSLPDDDASAATAYIDRLIALGLAERI